MAEIINLEDFSALKTLVDIMESGQFRFEDQRTRRRLDTVAAHLMKDLLFSLSMLCKEKGWHQTGLCLSVGCEHLETMLEQGVLTQSLENLKKTMGDI